MFILFLIYFLLFVFFFVGISVWNRETNIRLNSFRLSSNVVTSGSPALGKKVREKKIFSFFRFSFKQKKFIIFQVLDSTRMEHITNLNFINEQTESSLLVVSSDDGIVRVWGGYDQPEKLQLASAWRACSSRSAPLFSAWNQGLSIVFYFVEISFLLRFYFVDIFFVFVVFRIWIIGDRRRIRSFENLGFGK